MTYFTLALLEKQPDLFKVLLMETFSKNKYYKVQKPMIRQMPLRISTCLCCGIRCQRSVNARKQRVSWTFGGSSEGLVEVFWAHGICISNHVLPKQKGDETYSLGILTFSICLLILRKSRAQALCQKYWERSSTLTFKQKEFH